MKGRPGNGGAGRQWCCWQQWSSEKGEVGLGKIGYLVGLDRKIGEVSSLRESMVFFLINSYSAMVKPITYKVGSKGS